MSSPPPSKRKVGRKPEDILLPEDDLAGVELADLIDTVAVRSLLDDFHELTGIPLAVIDLQGRVLVGAGWSDICTRFHRVNPETCAHCIESDTLLTTGVPEGESRLYRCKNNMWDVATPIMIDGRHVGNVFSGQFFFEEEAVDLDLFRDQARRYGFDETAYLAALEQVPRISRHSVDTAMSFFAKLAHMLSQLSHTSLGLARSMTTLELQNKALVESEQDLSHAQQVAQMGSWRLDVRKDELRWSQETYRMFGITPGTELTYEEFLSFVHPDDRELVDSSWAAALKGAPYDLEHRILVADEVKWVRERAILEFDSAGELAGGFGSVLDITESKRVQVELSAANAETARLFEEQRTLMMRLQETLLDLPKELPGVRFGHLYRSATREARVGGDFYDVFEAKHGRIGLLVGDVSGRGIEAARVASLVKDTVHAFAHLFGRPHQVLRETNRLLVEKQTPGFVTAFVGFLDPEDGTFVYSSAGHPAPLVAANGGIEALKSAGTPLGAFPDARYRDIETKLPRESRLVFYTDGITEARRDGEFFGEQGLKTALAQMMSEPVEKLPALLLDEALRFTGGHLEDDVAVLAVDYVGRSVGEQTA